MQRLRSRLLAIARCDAPVLISGESGTGKELVAQSLHCQSCRKRAPLVALNCAAFPDALLEAELFGYERGAFTGATRRREGRFAAADGGTLFLDEIAEMPPNSQAKLLRVLEDGAYQPLGTNRTVRADVRLISASNVDLKQRIARGLFREDLYYRLKVFSVQMPPLRNRADDLAPLVRHFVNMFCSSAAALPSISPCAWAALTHYPFPGNVRELRHAIQHGVVLAQGGEIRKEHLPEEFRVSTEQESAEGACRPLAVAMREFEREYLFRVLRQVGGSRTRAAQLLQISRKNLWEKLRRYGIQPS